MARVGSTGRMAGVEAQMPRIFISYRRDDSLDIAGRIHDRLAAHFRRGGDEVFLDVASIPAGVDFRRFLTESVAQCDVMLVVIGRQWLDCRIADGPRAGQRRLDDPADFVRIEVAAALARGIPIIPVLVNGSAMPGSGQLPSDLIDLAFRNAAEVRSGPDFRAHMDRLVQGIEQLPKPTPPPKAKARKKPGWTLPWRREALSTGADRAAKELTNSIGMTLVLIPPGEFLMGSPDADAGAFGNEKPQHRVQITTPFFLSRHPVTQDQYRQVTGGSPSVFRGNGRLPVECVSWFDAVAFCNALSEREKLAPLYNIKGEEEVTILGGAGYRLPTEAEWEYACRAGTTTRYGFGDDPFKLGEYAWFLENSGEQTHPVGQKEPNAWGLYDMHGNVWELCWDGYDDGYYRQSVGADPAGPAASALRVIRGGFCRDHPRDMRAASRRGYKPSIRYGHVGFRCARAQAGK